MQFVIKISLINILIFSFKFIINCEQNNEEIKTKDSWKRKDVRDYSDVDVERLYDQWEESETDPLEQDELPEWERPRPKIDLSKLDPTNPESMLKMSKKGQTLMMFASISGTPNDRETEQVTSLWQSSLFNAHLEVQRYIVGDGRVLFVLKDGSQAWEVKDFLVNQNRCSLVTIEGKDYPGKGGNVAMDSKDTKKETKKKSDNKAKKDNVAAKTKKTTDKKKKQSENDKKKNVTTDTKDTDRTKKKEADNDEKKIINVAMETKDTQDRKKKESNNDDGRVKAKTENEPEKEEKKPKEKNKKKKRASIEEL